MSQFTLTISDRAANGLVVTSALVYGLALSLLLVPGQAIGETMTTQLLAAMVTQQNAEMHKQP